MQILFASAGSSWIGNIHISYSLCKKGHYYQKMCNSNPMLINTSYAIIYWVLTWNTRSHLLRCNVLSFVSFGFSLISTHWFVYAIMMTKVCDGSWRVPHDVSTTELRTWVGQNHKIMGLAWGGTIVGQKTSYDARKPIDNVFVANVRQAGHIG
jgi:hypothetical protein